MLFLSLVLPGCGDKDEEEVSQTRSYVSEKNDVKFTVTVSAEKISVADILKIDFAVESPEDFKLILPSSETDLGEFEIINVSQEKRNIISEKRIKLTGGMELAPFLSGKKKIPGFELKVEGKDKFTLKVQDIDIEVLSAFAGDIPAELKGIAPPRVYPESYLTVLIISVIVIILIISYLLWRFKLRKEVTETIVKTPYEIAFEQLALLRDKGLVDKGMIKEFYSEVSNILRFYIEGRFALRAPELTTEEFMEQLRNSDKLTVEYKNLLQEFLQHCDMVKFAALAPSATDIVNTIESCERFVEETKPAEEEADSNAA
jgi:hypothetical protein